MSRFIPDDTSESEKLDINVAQAKTIYFERIWSKHYKGELKDIVATGSVRDLIDFFVLPSITTRDWKDIPTPFANPNFSDFIIAGSGFGKTTLLHIMLLCSLVEERITSQCSVIRTSVTGKEDKYLIIKKFLFGTPNVNYFPVYIDSKKANSTSYTSVLDLAEENTCDFFLNMVETANAEGTLLLLIDSIDEVEHNKKDEYLSSIKTLLAKYKNANIVLTSRFTGKNDLPFNCDLLHLKELSEEDIKQITSSILSEPNAKRFLKLFNENQHVRLLARNPFILMTFLENKNEYVLHHMIESVVNAIIELRWNKKDIGISLDNIKLLLGFLACSFVFGNKECVTLSDTRKIFNNINENFKINGVPYDIPQDNVDYFVTILSSKSGILNVEMDNHIEQVYFQDYLVECWLAANYINNIVNKRQEINEYDGVHGIWTNMNWLDKFVQSFESRAATLSDRGVYTLMMSLVMCSENYGPALQKMFLHYLICRDATSINSSEQQNISAGYDALIKNEFGTNDLTNLRDGESRILIEKMLKTHSKRDLKK